MAERRVAVVTEFAPADLPTGVQRRHDHLVAALEAAGAEVVTVPLSPGRSRRSMGLPERLRVARGAGRAVTLPAAVPAVVVGLGTPTMAIAARRLRRGGRAVAFDESDSVLLQLRSRVATRSARLVAIALWQLALQVTAPVAIASVYISERDLAADRRVLRRRARVVVPPAAAAELVRLPPVRHPLERVVVPVELASHHSAEGFAMLLAAQALQPAPVPVEVWGPTAPERPLPPGVRYAGFADRLADVYSGDTAVVVVNVGGSGVPNKLVEAAASGRPALVHASLADRLPGGFRGWTFGDAASLAGLLQRAVVEAPARQVGAGADPADGGRRLLAVLGVRGGDRAAA